REDELLNPFVAPETLHLPFGFDGNIVWYLFTPGWELSSADGVVFPAGSPFEGAAQQDPTRERCWTAAVANILAGTFNYSIHFRRIGDLQEYQHDPVIENDPPPTLIAHNVKKRRRSVAQANV